MTNENEQSPALRCGDVFGRSRWALEYTLRSTCQTHSKEYVAPTAEDAYDLLFSEVDNSDVSRVAHHALPNIEDDRRRSP